MDIAATLDLYATELQTVGLRATVDPQKLNPPCVWVAARSVAHDLLSGGGTVRIDLWLIAPDTGTPQALRTLGEMLRKALTAVDPDFDTSLSESVALPGGGPPLPAFRITVDHETC